jgi:sugar diacid utilization regulator
MTPHETRQEVERVVDALLERQTELAEVMVEAILAEIPPYAQALEGVVEDVRAHCDAHAGLILEVARDDRAPLREELVFAREAAGRRVRQGIPLDGLLQAFRVGHRTVWEAIVTEATSSDEGRDAAIALVRPAMEYIDICSTQVAEAYLKEEQRLNASADRERRDLLEDLLAGRLPAPGERPAAIDLDPAADLLVAIARPAGAAPQARDALEHVADALASHLGADVPALVVVRQREVVAVVGVADGRGGEAAATLLRETGEALRARGEGELRAGLSTVCFGFAGVARGFAEARQAVDRADAERPVVALTDLSPFEYLVASADSGALRTIAAKGRLLVETDADGTARETLLAYVACDLSVRDTAERLVVHPNTVRYRLRRISELTGRDTRRFEDLVDLVTVIRAARARG